MDIKYLKYFQAVARYGSINQASKAMYISQPHLSHIIKEVESEAGFELFHRTKQGCILTKNGEKYLRHCEVILQEMENLKNFTHEVKKGESSMGVSMTKFSHTAECFNEICRKYQNAERFSYSLNEGATVDVIEDVISGTYNVGVIHFAHQEADMMEKMFADKELSFLPLSQFSPYVVISSNHELLLHNQELDISELKNYGFVRYIGQFEDFIYHITTENQRFDLNESQKIVYVHGRGELMHLISTSNFFTIGISEFSYQDSMYRVASVPICNCTEQLQFGVITKQNAKLSEAENEFIERLADCYQQLHLRENHALASSWA